MEVSRNTNNLIVGTEKGVRILSVSRDGNVSRVEINTPQSVLSVATLENNLFVVGGFFGLRIYESESNPVLISEMNDLNVISIGVIDYNRLLVGVSDSPTLYVINISDPFSPYVESNIGLNKKAISIEVIPESNVVVVLESDIQISNDYFVPLSNGGGVYLIDVSDSLNLRIINSYSLPATILPLGIRVLNKDLIALSYAEFTAFYSLNGTPTGRADPYTELLDITDFSNISAVAKVPFGFVGNDAAYIKDYPSYLVLSWLPNNFYVLNLCNCI